MSNLPKDPFAAADRHWDLPSLYRDLANAKGQPLTPTEQLHLRGLLSGHSPTAIAKHLSKSPSGVTTDLSSTLYRYIKTLTRCPKIHHWRDITALLDQAGYNIHNLTTDPLPSTLLPLNLTGRVAAIHIDASRIIIELDRPCPDPAPDLPSPAISASTPTPSLDPTDLPPDRPSPLMGLISTMHQDGIQTGIRQVARNLKAIGMTPTKISSLTGLTPTDIETLDPLNP